MKQLMMKKVMVSSLALAMVFGGGTAAFADGKGHGHDRDRDHDSEAQFDWKMQDHGKKMEVKLTFDDMRGNDVEWAMRYIASLASKGVFEGYEDGTFKPRNEITRIEAITAAVRLMGLKEKAESPQEMQTKLNFKDADKIPAWATGYVAVALENDLFLETDDSVQPRKPADRLWATMLLVKALKLDGEAKAKMNTTLNFKDENKIPAGAVGYVAVAVEKGLIDGFEDNTFRPNAPVTRAQLAALLDRTGDHMPEDNSSAKGTVGAAVYSNVLTLNKAGQAPQQLTLNPNAFIYRNGVQVSASALQVGDEVRVRMYNNVVIFVEVTKMAEAGHQDFTTAGTFNSMTLDATGKISTISITQSVYAGGSQTAVYNVSPNVTINGNVSLLVPSHAVVLQGRDQVVTSIVIN